ncbi:hypothetical protein PRIPAC_96386, partial [Pristionchus pacificus]|uniref:Uncharacterized protein n=1 Tax=Pristionchus pacificus TaxID=54126 RepID=A0A2A6D185_PRIPA
TIITIRRTFPCQKMSLPNKYNSFLKELKEKSIVRKSKRLSFQATHFAQSQNDRLGYVIIDALNVLQFIESGGISSSNISLDMANNALSSSGSYALSQESDDSDSIRTLAFSLCEALSRTVSSLLRPTSEDGDNTNSSCPLPNKMGSLTKLSSGKTNSIELQPGSQPNNLPNSIAPTGTSIVICTQRGAMDSVPNATRTSTDIVVPMPATSCNARQGAVTSAVDFLSRNSSVIENEPSNIPKVFPSQSESNEVQSSSTDPSEYVGFRQKLKRNTVSAPNYTELDDLEDHVLLFTASIEDTAKFACSQCSKLFTTARGLKCHERTHSYLRCTLCSRSMKDINALEVHMSRIHSNIEGTNKNIDSDANEPPTKKSQSTHFKDSHH